MVVGSVVVCTRVRLRGRWVTSVRHGGLWVLSRARWGSLGLSWVVGLTPRSLCSHRVSLVHPLSLGSPYVRPLGVVGLFRGRLGTLARALGVDRFIRCRWVRSGAPLV